MMMVVKQHSMKEFLYANNNISYPDASILSDPRKVIPFLRDQLSGSSSLFSSCLLLTHLPFLFIPADIPKLPPRNWVSLPKPSGIPSLSLPSSLS